MAQCRQLIDKLGKIFHFERTQMNTNISTIFLTMVVRKTG